MFKTFANTANGDRTDSIQDEVSVRANGATLTRHWNMAIVQHNREQCLNPISSVSSHFSIRRGPKDRY